MKAPKTRRRRRTVGQRLFNSDWYAIPTNITKRASGFTKKASPNRTPSTQ